METINNFINGKRVCSTSNRFSEVHNPATGKIIRRVPLSTAQEVEQTIAVAAKAWVTWSQVSPLKRSRVMAKYKILLEQNQAKIARTISEEHGKVYTDAMGELMRGIEVVEFACGAPQLLKGEFTENVGTQVDSHSIRQSLGVVAGITPFNFPAMVPMWMFPMAIICGNTFILKVSEKDPSTAVLIAELLTEAGLPDGVFNVVHGDKEAVDTLLTNPTVKAISFVGSTPIARYVYQTASAHGKRVQALGGAKNHMIIMPNTDLDVVVNALVGAAYGSAGERCMAISVAVPVTDAVADNLVQKLAHKVKQLKIGAGEDEGIEMGPVISKEHLERIKSYIELGVKEGAQLVVDGRDYRVPNCDYQNGFFIGGTLFDRVAPNSTIHKEEIFGPVLSVVRADSYRHAVDIVSSSEYGNGVSIFTRDGATARDFVHRIEVGMVGVNVPIPVPMAFHSFGGWKHSLFGDHHIHGAEGVRFYTRLKTVTTRWLPSKHGGEAQFDMPTM